MAKFWLFDGRTLAKKIKTSGLPSIHEVKDSTGASWECPQCSYRIDKCDDWPGLPSGVKFDPSDVELLDHLAAKCGVGNERLHEYIDVFVPTIDVEQGICYKHPESLPVRCYEQKCLVSFPTAELKDDLSLPVCGDDSNAINSDAFHHSFSGEGNMDAHYPLSGSSFSTNNAAGTARDICPGTAELENLDLGSPPYVNLTELYFPCEDSISGWLDWS